MNSIKITAGLAALGLAGPAFAQGGAERVQQDQTRAEAEARAAAAFDRMDTNRDGVLSPEERRAAGEQMRARFAERRAERMASLTDEQRAAIAERRAARGGEARQGRRGGEARAERRGGEGRRAQEPVGRDQFVARALERFDRLDRDSNGIVTAEERRAASAERRAARR